MNLFDLTDPESHQVAGISDQGQLEFECLQQQLNGLIVIETPAFGKKRTPSLSIFKEESQKEDFEDEDGDGDNHDTDEYESKTNDEKPRSVNTSAPSKAIIVTHNTTGKKQS